MLIQSRCLGSVVLPTILRVRVSSLCRLLLLEIPLIFGQPGLAWLVFVVLPSLHFLWLIGMSEVCFIAWLFCEFCLIDG